MEKQKLTGYPSIDKPWLKYYNQYSINMKIPSMTAFSFLRHCNQEHLDFYAIRYMRERISFHDFFDKVDEVARSLRALGVKEDDVVTILAATTPEVYYLFYALNKIGAAANMIDPRTNAQGIADYICQSKSRFLFSIDMCLEKIEQIEQMKQRNLIKDIVIFTPVESQNLIIKLAYSLQNKEKKKDRINYITWHKFILLSAIDGKKDIDAVPYVENRLAAIVHTGGTTGTPKGVRLTNENFVAMACQLGGDNQSIDMPLPFKRGWKNLNIMPPFIAYGLCTCLYMMMCRGMESILIPQVNVKKFPEQLLKYKPEVFAGSPPFYEEMLKSKLLHSADLSFWMNPIVGGDAVNEKMEHAINEFLKTHGCNSKLCKGYGLTEVGGVATVCSQRKYNEYGSVGIPLPQTIIGIFDPDSKEELPYESTGEVCIQTPTLMQRYDDNQKETDMIIQEHTSGEKWLHSMDLGHMNSDGLLFIDGRIKRIIIHADGWKIYASAVEKVIEEHANVLLCAVVGKAIPNKQGKTPVAFIVMKKVDKNSEIEIHNLCVAKLPEYEVPTQIYFVNELPYTSIGKVDYRALEYEAQKRAEEYQF